ncbi:MAG: hypothetical protein S4CHLAM102_12800 [Chlamydiia bacterium]|nr:hypothetical protein [Chlamydiia bacterium]
MDWGKRAHFYTQHGYDMFILDYRMFGKSRGEIVESEIVDDCLHVYDWLADRYGEEKISVIGQSLGTGFATQVSAQRSPKQLILEAPYFSLLEQSYLEKPFIPKFLIRSILKYPIRTDQYISKVECPIYFIHGTADKLCPFNASERLHAMVKEGVETKIYPLEGWGHKHFPKNAHYHEVLAEIFGDELD